MELLFVEDNLDDQRLIRQVIGAIDAHIKVHFSGDGLEALRFLGHADRLPDLIFLDINMPRMNGLETLQALKEDERLQQIPAFIFSTAGDTVSLSVAKRLGAQGYIVKPLHYSNMKSCLSQLLRMDAAAADAQQEFLHVPLSWLEVFRIEKDQ